MVFAFELLQMSYRGRQVRVCLRLRHVRQRLNGVRFRVVRRGARLDLF